MSGLWPGVLGGQITSTQQFLYVANTFSQIILKAPFTITSTTQTASPVTTFAGTAGPGSFSGDNGAATSALTLMMKICILGMKKISPGTQ